MIDRIFWGAVILFFVGTIIYVTYELTKLDDKIANCKGLVVKTPEGWVCSTAQKV
jgi:hypothetical protein